MKTARQMLDIPISPPTGATGPGIRAPRAVVVGAHDGPQRRVDLRLRRAGFAVVRADDGAGAMSMAACDPPDLIVLNQIVRAANVRSVLGLLRRGPRTADLPILLLAPNVTGALAITCRTFAATLVPTGVRKPRTKTPADAPATASLVCRAPGQARSPAAATERVE